MKGITCFIKKIRQSWAHQKEPEEDPFGPPLLLSALSSYILTIYKVQTHLSRLHAQDVDLVFNVLSLGCSKFPS